MAYRFRLTLVNLALFVLSGTAQAAIDNATDHAAVVAPYVDDSVIAVAFVDLSRLDFPGLANEIVRFAALKSDGAETLKADLIQAQSLVDSLRKAGAQWVYGVVSLEDIPDAGPFLIAPVAEGGSPRAVAGLLFCGDAQGPTSSLLESQRRNWPFEVCLPLENVVLAGSRATIKRLQAHKPTPRADIAEPLGVVGQASAGAVISLSADCRRVVREMFPRLPEPLADVNGPLLADGLRWLAVQIDHLPRVADRTDQSEQTHQTHQTHQTDQTDQTDRRAAIQVDPSSQVELKLIVEAAKEQDAQRISQFIRKGLQGLGDVPHVKKAAPNFTDLASMLTPTLEGKRLTIALNKNTNAMPTIVELVRHPIDAARESAQRTLSMDTLKQLALAMHNYHDRNKSLPPTASYDKHGNPLLSWRVHILPFIDQAELYKRFHLDEPWDSEHNRQLMAEMPAEFASPGSGLHKKGMANYLAPVGDGMAFSGKEGIPLKDFKDGTSNTLMLVEVDPQNAVIWTKPDDHPVDLGEPLRGLVVEGRKGFLAARADGSVQFLPREIDPKILRALFTRSGGEAP